MDGTSNPHPPKSTISGMDVRRIFGDKFLGHDILGRVMGFVPDLRQLFSFTYSCKELQKRLTITMIIRCIMSNKKTRCYDIRRRQKMTKQLYWYLKCKIIRAPSPLRLLFLVSDPRGRVCECQSKNCPSKNCPKKASAYLSSISPGMFSISPGMFVSRKCLAECTLPVRERDVMERKKVNTNFWRRRSGPDYYLWSKAIKFPVTGELCGPLETYDTFVSKPEQMEWGEYLEQIHSHSKADTSDEFMSAFEMYA